MTKSRSWVSTVGFYYIIAKFGMLTLVIAVIDDAIWEKKSGPPRLIGNNHKDEQAKFCCSLRQLVILRDSRKSFELLLGRKRVFRRR